jgi:hypothetical protein
MEVLCVKKWRYISLIEQELMFHVKLNYMLYQWEQQKKIRHEGYIRPMCFLLCLYNQQSAHAVRG